MLRAHTVNWFAPLLRDRGAKLTSHRTTPGTMRSPAASSSSAPSPALVLGRVLSVQAGRIQKLGVAGADDPLRRPWRSAFFKSAIAGTVEVGTLGLADDQQADRRHHGGPDKALLMYSADHFDLWRHEYALADLAPGGFGENLTVAGFAEADVCLGDRLRVGTALLEVSQPRQPCSNINRRWGRKGITEAVVANGWGGWYLRVLEPGTLGGGADEVRLAERAHPGLTVSLATDALYRRCDDPAVFAALLDCPALPESFKRGLRGRLAELTA